MKGSDISIFDLNRRCLTEDPGAKGRRFDPGRQASAVEVEEEARETGAGEQVTGEGRVAGSERVG